MKVANKGYFRGKKLWRHFSKAKMEECIQTNLNFFNKLGMVIPWSVIYFMEMSALISHKIASQGSLRGRKNPKN